MFQKLWSTSWRTRSILHTMKWLQSGCSWIAVTRLPVSKNCEATWRAHTYAVILLHHHHPTTLRRHKLWLLLEYGQCLLAHVRRCFGEAINIFYISFTKFYGVRRIHSMVALVDRVELLLNDLDLPTWL